MKTDVPGFINDRENYKEKRYQVHSLNAQANHHREIIIKEKILYIFYIEHKGF